MNGKVRSAFTLIEVLMVVVIMAIVAAILIPQFARSTTDAKVNTTAFNLNTLRGQIEMYKAQHGGGLPTITSGELTELLTVTTYNTKNYGPYLINMPENTVNSKWDVKAGTAGGIVVGDVDGSTGWVYDATTGEVRINDMSHWQK